MSDWVSVEDELPKEGVDVLVWKDQYEFNNGPYIAKLRRGLTLADRELMRSGDKPDPVVHGYIGGIGTLSPENIAKRSVVWAGEDEGAGNNEKPYRWYGQTTHDGQAITHWAHITPPK